ncbi:hypothetical protein HSISM1_1132 [Streptococcus sp. HSISM1]|nr:hypothetical protein HSISM1_1132 [Streptococcus sp. HSISM1]
MKKLKKIWPLILVVLGLSFFGLYKFLKTSVNPGLFDRNDRYIRVYNYKSEKIKPKRSKVKEINLEFIYDDKAAVPDGLTWSEDLRSDIGPYDGGDVILHAVLEDGSKIRISLQKAFRLGPTFSRDLDRNDELEEKMLPRFPKFSTEYNRNYSYAYFSGMMYVGDALYQAPKTEAVTRFDLKNPKTGKLQTYYEYGYLPEKTDSPVYLKTKKDVSQADMQSFYDDYHDSWKGYWDRGVDSIPKELTSTYPYQFHYYKWFYSDSLSNLPLKIDLTGSEFKTIVTRTQLIKPDQNDQMKVRTATKTYTEKNKGEYVQEVLGKLREFKDINDLARYEKEHK